ncbi:MAG: hypothetical protein VYD19_03250 [Myxococcota bacterium]|nr:hypothetical protein [Myxococcota bacterium]
MMLLLLSVTTFACEEEESASAAAAPDLSFEANPACEALRENLFNRCCGAIELEPLSSLAQTSTVEAEGCAGTQLEFACFDGTATENEESTLLGEPVRIEGAPSFACAEALDAARRFAGEAGCQPVSCEKLGQPEGLIAPSCVELIEDPICAAEPTPLVEAPQSPQISAESLARAPASAPPAGPTPAEGAPEVWARYQAPELLTPLSKLRLTIPEDFLRQAMATVLFPELTRTLDRNPNFSCEADALSCTLELIAPLGTLIEGALSRVPRFELLGLSPDGFKALSFDTPWGLVRWQGGLDVRYNSGAVDLAASRVRLIPAHTPGEANGYPVTPSETDLLDLSLAESAVLFVDEARCATLGEPVLESPGLRAGGAQGETPFQCRCALPPDQPSERSWRPYCIYDPYPWPGGLGELEVALEDGEAHRVRCDESDPEGLGAVALRDRFSLSSEEALLLSEGIKRFGCAGFATAGGAWVGLEWDLEVEPGSLSIRAAQNERPSLELVAPLTARLARPLERHEFGSLGWERQRGALTEEGRAEVSYLFALSVGEGLALQGETLPLRAQLVLWRDAQGRQQVTLRRLVAPALRWRSEGTLALSLGEAERCTLSGVGLRLGALECPEGLGEQLGAVAIESLEAQLIEPLKASLAEEIEALLSKLYFGERGARSSVAGSTGGLWASLFAGSWDALMTPRRSPDALYAEATLDALPTPLAWLCQLAEEPDSACFLLARLFGENGPLPAPLRRLGAMTHGDSLGEFAEPRALSDTFPPTRFCSEGDLPPIAAPLDPIVQRVGAVLEAQSPLAPPRWQRQCALFLDLEAGGEMAAPRDAAAAERAPDQAPARFRFSPTRRSEWTLNAALRCVDPYRCDLSGAADLAPEGRATLALCSLLGDLWYLPEGALDAAGTPERWRSVIELLSAYPSPESRALVDALFAGDPLSDDFLKGLFAVDYRECGARLAAAGLPVDYQPSFPAGRCFRDIDCASSDPCLEGTCLEGTCAYQRRECPADRPARCAEAENTLWIGRPAQLTEGANSSATLLAIEEARGLFAVESAQRLIISVVQGRDTRGESLEVSPEGLIPSDPQLLRFGDGSPQLFWLGAPAETPEEARVYLQRIEGLSPLSLGPPLPLSADQISAYQVAAQGESFAALWVREGEGLAALSVSLFDADGGSQQVLLSEARAFSSLAIAPLGEGRYGLAWSTEGGSLSFAILGEEGVGPARQVTRAPTLTLTTRLAPLDDGSAILVWHEPALTGVEEGTENGRLFALRVEPQEQLAPARFIGEAYALGTPRWSRAEQALFIPHNRVVEGDLLPAISAVSSLGLPALAPSLLQPRGLNEREARAPTLSLDPADETPLLLWRERAGLIFSRGQLSCLD